jgi:hypothetical protein
MDTPILENGAIEKMVDFNGGRGRWAGKTQESGGGNGFT